ncbi:MAG: glycoside hydrolase family 125 protein [Alistipes sp.]
MKKLIFSLLITLAAGLSTAASHGVDYSKTARPPKSDRLFTSTAIEQQIEQVKSALSVDKLAWMFENCFPNTLDTTVHYRKDKDGKDDTFVYTGDIHAMWLRDSGAQVWPYVRFAAQDKALRHLIAGVIRRQFTCLLIDPYANAFNDGPTGTGWQDDWTVMLPDLHERKWEIDSPCYVIRLAHGYWKATGDASIFDDSWVEVMRTVLTTFRAQQRKEGLGPYHFQRVTETPADTQLNGGYGNPVKPVGLIASAFRPSDDATTFPFLIPSNFFAVTSLRKASEILRAVNHEELLAAECDTLAAEVEQALKQYALYDHPKYGKIYAFEVDGFGNQLLMDDANVPSLLALAYMGDVAADDPIYRNTRRFVWSDSNPYFFSGKVIEGVGGPHIGFDMVWPMSLMMKAFTSTDDAEIKWCVETLVNTDADTGFIHESVHKDDATKFTRPWFAWQNSLFGELILKLIDDGKIDLLNNIEVK